MANKPTKRQTLAEVKAVAMAKAAVKIAKKEAQLTCIQCVAEFESSAKHNKDITDAMSRPNFVPHGHPISEPNSDGHYPGA